jgi:hypothetical protein
VRRFILWRLLRVGATSARASRATKGVVGFWRKIRRRGFRCKKDFFIVRVEDVDADAGGREVGAGLLDGDIVERNAFR